MVWYIPTTFLHFIDIWAFLLRSLLITSRVAMAELGKLGNVEFKDVNWMWVLFIPYFSFPIPHLNSNMNPSQVPTLFCRQNPSHRRDGTSRVLLHKPDRAWVWSPSHATIVRLCTPHRRCSRCCVDDRRPWRHPQRAQVTIARNESNL